MDLQTMVDTLQEVRVPRVPTWRGWRVSYEAMRGESWAEGPSPDHLQPQPFAGQKQDLRSLGLTG